MTTDPRRPNDLRLLWKLRLARLVLAGGMPRSGSTLIFNIIRLCLESRYGTQLASGWIGDALRLPRTPAYLLKVHVVTPLLQRRAQTIFYTFRDVREAMLSAQRKFGVTPSIEQCREYIREYREAVGYADCLLRYETFNADIPGTISQVGRQLQIPVDADRILAVLPDPGGSTAAGYDRKTLLHAGHATGTEAGSWRRELPATLQRQISVEFSGWLREHGYPPE